MRRRTLNRRSTSGGESAEVGSSRMMMRAPEKSTRAISISCCRPIGRSPMRLVRIDIDAERGELLARGPRHVAPPYDAETVRRLVAEEDVLGDASDQARCSAPDAPCRCRQRGRRGPSGTAPRDRRSCRCLTYSVCTPAMIFIVVLLPAPFSPTRPWISPARREKSTSRRASTPPKDFETPTSSSSGLAGS